MPQYNPYFFQVLGTPILQRRRDALLLLLGGAALISTGLDELRAPPGCEDRLGATREAIRRGALSRSHADMLALSLLWRLGLLPPRISGVAVANADCNQLDLLLREQLRLYPQVVNDARRGYVLLVEGDEEACREWGSQGPKARASRLARIASEEAHQLGYKVVGAIIMVLGTLLRLTPAYHILALAATLVAEKHADPCSVPASGLRSTLTPTLLAERLSALIGPRSRNPQGRVGELLAAAIGELCEALRVLRGSVEAVGALRRVVLRFDAVAETLDPSVYLEGGLGALGVPRGSLVEELEAALARCGS